MQIPLSQNQVVTVDDQDHPALSQHRWCYRAERHGGRGYAVRNAKIEGKYKLVYLHRQLMQPPEGHEVIFLDHDHLNCQRSNLKVVTIAEARRFHRVRADSESGIKGLHYHWQSQRWHANLRIKGRPWFLGSFETQAEAQKAYDDALKEHYPDLVAAQGSGGPELVASK